VAGRDFHAAAIQLHEQFPRAGRTLDATVDQCLQAFGQHQYT
jgi:hypothetical protein